MITKLLEEKKYTYIFMLAHMATFQLTFKCFWFPFYVKGLDLRIGEVNIIISPPPIFTINYFFITIYTRKLLYLIPLFGLGSTRRDNGAGVGDESAKLAAL